LETLADAIWTVGLQIQNPALEQGKSKAKNKEWVALVEFVKQLVKQAGPDMSSMMAKQLEGEMLYDADIVPSFEAMEKRLKKINTDNVYRQQKYNLLREEVMSTSNGSVKFIGCDVFVFLIIILTKYSITIVSPFFLKHMHRVRVMPR
jgi:hypothetical protein